MSLDFWNQLSGFKRGHKKFLSGYEPKALFSESTNVVMESSAKGILQVPNWARLKRDKSNYVPWQRAIMEVLEAAGCEAAITEDFAKLRFKDEDYDSESSSDDSGVPQQAKIPQSDAKAAYSIFPNLPAFFNFIYPSKPRYEKRESNEEDKEDEKEGTGL